MPRSIISNADLIVTSRLPHAGPAHQFGDKLVIDGVITAVGIGQKVVTQGSTGGVRFGGGTAPSEVFGIRLAARSLQRQGDARPVASRGLAGKLRIGHSEACRYVHAVTLWTRLR
jgi:hypothetical protein